VLAACRPSRARPSTTARSASTLAPDAPRDRDVVTALLRRLLADGIAVERVAAVASSLEDRFLT
jgi:hypothetical protein